jgi:hypothetical protein
VQTALVTDIQPAMALLETTPFLFETLLRDLPADLLQRKPAPDRWSVSEVLAHLADIEQVYSERVHRFVAEESPTLQKYDQATSAGGDYSQGLAVEHLPRFITTRRAIVTFLKTVSPSAGAHTAKHSELGTITLSQMLNEWASHDLGHLRQIAEFYRAHGFHPHSGPFQKYSNPKP